jgi:hypothetical protein
VNVLQRDDDALVRRNVDAGDTRHVSVSLGCGPIGPARRVLRPAIRPRHGKAMPDLVLELPDTAFS